MNTPTVRQMPRQDSTPPPNPPKFNYWNVILLACLLFIIIMRIDTCNKNRDTAQEQQNFINSLSDTLKTVRLKDSSERTRISVLTMSNDKAFVELMFSDSQIVALQKVVDQYKNKLHAGSSVTTATTTTTVHLVGNTVLIVHDTVKVGDKIYLYPEYTDTIHNQWISYRATMNRTKTDLDLSIVNKYAVILGYEKKKPFVDVINFNPYSSTKILRSYQVSIPKQKVWGIGFSSGVCIGNGLKFQPYLGIGINYSIIKF